MKGSGDITALRLVHAGGNLNNGVNAGVTYRNSNNDLSNANSNNGSQLSYLFSDEWPEPCLLAKHKAKNHGCWYFRGRLSNDSR